MIRGAAVLALGDVFFYGEELEKGAVARLLGAKFSGELDVPWSRLPYHPYEGGGFFASHVKWLAFALLGENVLAHKVCALFWGVCVLGAAFVFARRHLGLGTACWLGAFMVLGPLHWQKQSLLHLGIHFEALLFALIAFDRSLRIAGTPRDRSANRLDLIVLGLVGGFGLWFSYQLALVLAVCGALLLVTRRARLLGAEGGLALAAFAIGAAPLACMWSQWGTQVFDLHGSAVGNGGGFRSLVGFVRGLGAATWHSPSATLQALGLGALMLFGLVRLTRRSAGEEPCVEPATGRLALATLTVFALLWLLVAGRSGLVAPEYRHFFELLRWAPFVMVLLVLAAAGAASRLGRRVPVALGAISLALGAVQSARIVFEGSPGSPARNLAVLRAAPGLAWVQTYSKLIPRQTGALAERALPFLARGVDDGERLALAAACLHDAPDSFVTVLRVLLEEEPGARAAFVMGLGEGLHFESQGSHRRALNRLQELPLAERNLRAEALGRFGASWWLPPAALHQFLKNTRGAPSVGAYRRGLGRALFHTLVLSPAGGPPFVAERTLLRPAAARAWILGALTPAECVDVLGGFDAEAAGSGL